VNEQLEALLVDVVAFVPKLVVSLIIFVASLVLAGAAQRWARRFVAARTDHVETQQLLARLARWSVIVGGTLVALDQVDFDITGFLTGLGILGFTVGFALQDVARNFIAGVLLLIQRPFNIGERVELAGFKGTVLSISTRDTVVETLDGEIVSLPNTSVLSNPIINYSQQAHRRRTLIIGLGYGQDVGEAMETFLSAMCQVEGVLETPEPEMLARELGESGLVLAARFWVDQRAYRLVTVQSKVVIALNAAAEHADIDLPYPIQTVRLERVPSSAES
jgi:small-conductance mechanosensitive channel